MQVLSLVVQVDGVLCGLQCSCLCCCMLIAAARAQHCDRLFISILCMITPDNRCLSCAVAVIMTLMMSREQHIQLQSCQKGRQNVQFRIVYNICSNSSNPQTIAATNTTLTVHTVMSHIHACVLIIGVNHSVDL